MGITIYTAGVCSQCAQEAQSREKTDSWFQQADKILRELATRNIPYHALVMFSGGKDSTYLLHWLTQNYKLKVLAFAVLHPFVPALAKENMDSAAKFFNIDLIKFKAAEEPYRLVMKGAIDQGYLNHTEFLGCQICGFFYNLISLKTAIEKNIPLIVNGNDPTQIEDHVPSLLDASSLKNNWEQLCNSKWGRWISEKLGQHYQSTIYEPSLAVYEGKQFPVYMAPYGFLDYNYRQISKTLLDLKVYSVDQIRSKDTNCDLHHFWSYFSYVNLDCHSYTKIISRGLRKKIPTLIDHFFSSETNLTRDEHLKILAEYKQILVVLAKQKTLFDSMIGDIIKHSPRFAAKFGNTEFKDFLHKIHQVLHSYAEFFQLSF